MAQHTASPPSQHHHHEHKYLPAMGHDRLLPLYDPLIRLVGIPAARRALIDQLDLRPGDRILDVGCGTGDLALALGRLRRDTVLSALDPDPRALARAARKLARHGVSVQLDQGVAEQLPYPDASFDHALSTFMFHHLEPDGRVAMLHEVRRVLRPGGSLGLVDFGGAAEHADGVMARLAHRNPRIRDNFGGRISELLREAGLAEPVETVRRLAFVVPYTIYRATNPG
jgi:ubiquinone/menaquinone biosynthesis C-methylase UbiE